MKKARFAVDRTAKTAGENQSPLCVHWNLQARDVRFDGMRSYAKLKSIVNNDTASLDQNETYLQKEGKNFS